MTFLQLIKRFKTEKDVVDHFIKVRYKNQLHCPHCGSVRVVRYKSKIKLFQCNDCNNTFSPFKNTIFEKSRTDLRKWVYAIHLIINAKKGISGCQLQREIGVTYKTAWRMLQQIRIAMGNLEQKEFKDAIIEIDETYIVSKDQDMENEKSILIGVLNRTNKQVHIRVAEHDEFGQRLTANQILSTFKNIIKDKDSNILMSDKFKSYNVFKKKGFIHLTINHSKNYSLGQLHVNNIESFWANIKRGIYGIYHHVSNKYLQRYVNEFSFRYNNKDNNMFEIILHQSTL